MDAIIDIGVKYQGIDEMPQITKAINEMIDVFLKIDLSFRRP
tara:strand:- start:119 stop:244 length:126 start_codon:yes stop_codon:yes gene_type:complete